MKVLFFGHTGIEKRQCIERLALHCLQKEGLPEDLDNLRARQFVRVFHLEDGIADLARGDYISYLDLFNAPTQRQIWSRAWDSMLAEIAVSQATHNFVTLHASYFRKTDFSQPRTSRPYANSLQTR